MYTHCPHCDTYFRVTSEQLKRAHGDVRCGRCFGTFNALQHLIDEPPAGAQAPQADEPAQIETATPGDAPPARGSTSPPTAASLRRDHSQQLIDELQQPASGPGGRPGALIWGLLSLPLLLLLAGQYAYFNLAPLSQQAELRPALTAMCRLLECELPLMRAPERIRLVERDIRSHPDTRDILLVQATMVNEADFSQAFPAVELVLHDITGHPIAGRRFLPEEYLVDPSLEPTRGFPGHTPVTIMLELVDPGAEAVGFEFNFL